HPVTNLELLTLVARDLNQVAGAAFGWYALRMTVPPGVTGGAQVRYRYANNIDEEIEKLRYDLYYVKHMSPWLDLRIAFDTVAVMVRGRGPRNPGENAAATPADARAFAFSRKVLTRIGLALMLLLPAPSLAQQPSTEEAPAGAAGKA